MSELRFVDLVRFFMMIRKELFIKIHGRKGSFDCLVLIFVFYGCAHVRCLTSSCNCPVAKENVLLSIEREMR